MGIVRREGGVVKWSVGRSLLAPLGDARPSTIDHRPLRVELIPARRGMVASRSHLRPMLSPMRFVAERILPAYLDALDQALEAALARLPAGSIRTTLLRLRRRGGRDGAWERFGALHRLAILGEAQGWLRAEEAIVIRKLAYRVAFLTMRAEAPQRSPRRAPLDEG